MEDRGRETRDIDYYMGLPYSVLLHQEKDDGEMYWIAEIPELPGCKSHGATVEEAVASVGEAREAWILDALEHGDEVPLPVDRERYSGRILVRMSRSLHHDLSLRSESEGVSLNQLIVTHLSRQLGRSEALGRAAGEMDAVPSLSSGRRARQQPAGVSERKGRYGKGGRPR